MKAGRPEVRPLIPTCHGVTRLSGPARFLSVLPRSSGDSFNHLEVQRSIEQLVRGLVYCFGLAAISLPTWSLPPIRSEN